MNSNPQGHVLSPDEAVLFVSTAVLGLPGMLTWRAWSPEWRSMGVLFSREERHGRWRMALITWVRCKVPVKLSLCQIRPGGPALPALAPPSGTTGQSTP